MSSGPSIASVRAGNIIGGGDWAADRLVPDAVRAFGAGNRLSVRNPDAVRPWQHVLDPARGMLLLAQRMIEDKNLPTSWNLGPSEDMAASVEDLLNLVVQEWGNSAGWDADRTHSGPYEAKLLRIDSSLAGARLPWKPAWSLERAVKATVDWYQAHLTQKDMKAFSLAQITAMEGAN